jgi:predicted nucleotidyltransferase component of viral defense system
MNKAIEGMLSRYQRRSINDHINALREVLQEIALCGLWRAKFHEKAALYGGTALRVLYGLNRFSEDLDFSLLAPDERFSLAPYCRSIEHELSSWGFTTQVEERKKTSTSHIESAFLKANTREQLLSIDIGSQAAAMVPQNSQLKIRIEVDTNPPANFSTETKFLLQPIPFSVKVYDPPSLFAGKMHALLCRSWRSRVKGRDWYDFVWYISRGTPLSLVHLEARMRQSGQYQDTDPLDENALKSMLTERIDGLEVSSARSEIERFLIDPSTVAVWSKEFFHAVAEKIVFT